MSQSSMNGQGMVVIGGADGIGRAITLLAAERGARVVFSAPPECKDVAEQIMAEANARDAGRVSSIAHNASSEAEIESLFDQAVDQIPELNVLVVNSNQEAAGWTKYLIETKLEDWNGAMVAGLRDPFLYVRRAVGEFLATGNGGRIVLAVSGTAASMGHVGNRVAQSALRALVRSLVKEYGPRDIACNILVADANHPDQVAETVLYLASSQASFVNGEVVHMSTSSLS